MPTVMAGSLTVVNQRPQQDMMKKVNDVSILERCSLLERH
jgi:hypothetical protein